MLNNTYKNISIDEAKELIKKGGTVADIRDPASYKAGHIKDAIHLSNDNIEDFVRDQDHNTPLLVCCYHGHSSQQAAQFLLSQGFTNTYSILGGYTAWAQQDDD